MRKGTMIISAIAALIAASAVFVCWQANDLTVTSIEYASQDVPDGFDGFRIVHISDLHNKRFGKGQSRLLDAVSDLRPDIIVITGDLIDARHTNIEKAMEFVRGAVKLAPVYYVSGNHEMSVPDKCEALSAQMLDIGVTMLENAVTTIERNGDTTDLIGISDPRGETQTADYHSGLAEFHIKRAIGDGSSNFKMLLAHRPELIDSYARFGINVVFSGHAHGGQFRLPWIGGLFAPNQGFFPKYTSGAYQVNGTTLVVSRGLGNSICPIRLFNRPNIVCVELKCVSQTKNN